MKSILSAILLLFASGVLLSSCNTATPEIYFGEAVLNSNMLVGFANEMQFRELESPSVKMDEATKQPVPMKRLEVISSKIEFVEKNLEKVKGLKQTAETKEMIERSIALHNLIIPVYKQEYTSLAKAFDAGASKEQVAAQAKSIHDKYDPAFQNLYSQLIASGKIYAEKNHINVKWN